ncbi:TetR/AcrR family transcriptional regulator [Nonomuraea sp. NPDC049309]|jgi:AcrR family transcriptional regulator|uniref:TetR/AcrR family transcriptional regulator n=1 Tax=Nonomuraea sp. NPDC049309 TaxID=3364350 RepID=UPI003711AF8D
MAYDADDTRRRIFEAATAEFAQYGLAGARVARIAEEAKANKQAIYLYYGSKEKLFAAVVRAKLEEVSCAVTIDPDAVAESVGQMFDWYREHPELIRLLLWEALEADDCFVGENERRAAFRDKVRFLADSGVVPASDDPSCVRAGQDLLFTLMGLIAWNFAVPGMCRAVLDEDDEQAVYERRRQYVIDTARLLTTARLQMS